MCRFEISYRNGTTKVYEVRFSPWPTWRMLQGLAKVMLVEKGGCAIAFHGPNGLNGFMRRSEI